MGKTTVRRRGERAGQGHTYTKEEGVHYQMCGWELPLVPLRGLSRFLTQNRKVKPQSMFGAAVLWHACRVGTVKPFQKKWKHVLKAALQGFLKRLGREWVLKGLGRVSVSGK